MDKEIKLSITMRDLTYLLIIVFIVTLALGIGFILGKLHSVKSMQGGVGQVPVQTHRNVRFISGQDAMPVNLDTEQGNNGANTDMTQNPEQIQKNIKNPKTINYASNSDNSSGDVVVETNQLFRGDWSDAVESNTTATADNDTSSSGIDNSSSNPGGAQYVASKNGTKYYPVGCKSADRIKPENRIYFNSAEEAEIEGLTPTTTCR